ncbi:CPC_1213 family protein [Clostridium thermobutyricum]|jgi:hypothetical protein|uniref:Uncharacterized protein n=2 Tax=Clostridium thermobutyricum TaxID=29372 RepID=N9XKQ7_9CLOT|nr:CPC_1213 family protein [Clostridium thermobutyricum]ENZ00263.1 hypothetical protein HMPREF1092_02778 [Clostridium thermobutyricum]OPX44650.1 hypothetical protein CLTHE_31740 [Clostridium thermobutyricum DSM 4928]
MAKKKFKKKHINHNPQVESAKSLSGEPKSNGTERDMTKFS